MRKYICKECGRHVFWARSHYNVEHGKVIPAPVFESIPFICSETGLIGREKFLKLEPREKDKSWEDLSTEEKVNFLYAKQTEPSIFGISYFISGLYISLGIVVFCLVLYIFIQLQSLYDLTGNVMDNSKWDSFKSLINLGSQIQLLLTALAATCLILSSFSYIKWRNRNQKFLIKLRKDV